MVTVANIDNKYVKKKYTDSAQSKIMSACDGTFETCQQTPNILP